MRRDQNLDRRWSEYMGLHTFCSMSSCEIPGTQTARFEPAVANTRAEIKLRHPLCPFITPSAPLLAAASPLTLRLCDNRSGGQPCDLHLDQWDVCKHGTSASKVCDVALQRVKCEGWGQTQPCTAGLRQCENTCGYLPQQLYIHGALATTGRLKGVLSSSICSFLLSSLRVDSVVETRRCSH